MGCGPYPSSETQCARLDLPAMIGRSKRSASAVAVLVVGWLWALPAAADDHLKRVSGLVGLGGSADGDPEDGVDHPTFQLGFSFEVERDLLVGVRAGRLHVGGEGFGPRRDPELTYATVAGEYLFSEGYYQSGVYLGLGLYRLDDGGSGVKAESSPGINLGLTGDFELNDRFSLLVELSGHYADLGGANFFTLFHAGVGYSF